MSPPESYKHKISVISPLSGSLADPGESELGQHVRLFGHGCLIKVTGSQLIAPFTGIVTELPATGYELKFKAGNGLQLWIRIGSKTHLLYGQGCQQLVKKGVKVTAGTPLLQFNPAMLKQMESPLYASIVIVNGQKLIACETRKARQSLAFEDVLMDLYL
ncbi:PTS glucose transporter subunit IIA [Salinimonas lutimaris]|uniref:PTS glucose transporter subunit IIA n=1 Tax=Salinimonas lutimaris TaxID=914153 RepID=UPI0010C03648|nr:PTS glucose transporter subunit IIA [Salinimonas lutimaris]